MAGENNHGTNCLDDPNFATICSFIEKFGEICHIGIIPFQDLQEMLENTNEVPLPLVELHIRLLRRVYKSINTNKWEKSICKFAHSFSNQDGWEIERCGYKKTKIQTKLRVLKNLLESQFDYNTKFKGEVNKLPASDLRLMPLGRDVEGHAYWYQVDLDANLRVYREDIDEETWEIVASSQEEMEQLITQLKTGEVGTLKRGDKEGIILEEDTNGFDDMDTKDSVPDIAQVSNDVIDDGADSDSDAALHIKEEDESCDSASNPNVTKSTSESVPAIVVTNQAIPESSVVSSNTTTVVEQVKTSAVKREELLTESKTLEVPKVTPASNTNTDAKEEPLNKVMHREVGAVPVAKNTVLSKEFTKQLENDAVATTKLPKELKTSVSDETCVLDAKSVSLNNVIRRVSSEESENSSGTKISESEIKISDEVESHLPQVVPTTMVSHENIDDVRATAEKISFPAAVITSRESEISSKDANVKEMKSGRGNKISKVSFPKINDVEPSSVTSADANVQEPKDKDVKHNALAIHNIVPSVLKPVKPKVSVHDELKNNEVTDKAIPETPDTKREKQDEVNVTEDTKNMQAEDTPREVEVEPKEVEEPPCKKSFAYVTGQSTPGIQEPKLQKTTSYIAETNQNQQDTGRTDVVKLTELGQTDSHSRSTLEGSTKDDNEIVSKEPALLESQTAKPLEASVKHSVSSLISSEVRSVQPPPEPTEELETTSPAGQGEKNEEALQTESIKPSGCDSVLNELDEVSNSSFELDSSEVSTATELPVGEPRETKMESIKEEKRFAATDSKNENGNLSVQPSNKCLAVENARDEPSCDPKVQREILPATATASLAKLEKLSALLGPVVPPSDSSNVEGGTLGGVLAKPEVLEAESTKPEVTNQIDNSKTISSPTTLPIHLENVSQAIHPFVDVLLERSTTAVVVTHSVATPIIDHSTDVNPDLIKVQSVPLESAQNTVGHSNNDSSDEMENVSLKNLKEDKSVTYSEKISLGEQDVGQKAADTIVSSENTARTKSSNGELSKLTNSSATVADIKKEETAIPSDVVENQPSKEAVPNVDLKTDTVDEKNSLVCKASPMAADDAQRTSDPTLPKASSLNTSDSDATMTKDAVEINLEEVNPKVTSQPSKLMGLVGYEYSSSDDEDDNEKEPNKASPVIVAGQKRKLVDVETGDQVEPKEKVAKSEEHKPSPVVGEAIEEDLMIVTGSGEGALNEGGNDTLSESQLAASQQSLVTSQDVEEAESSEDAADDEGGGLLPPAKGKGRGRPKKGSAKNGSAKQKTPRSRKKSPDANFSCRRNSLADDTNGTPASTGPTRRSGRVAQIRQKEEEERRKLEEERLAQLKEAQVRKQQKQKENESKGIKQSSKPSKISKKQNTPKQTKTKADKHVTYTPASDESESDSHDEDDDEEDDYERQLKTPKGRKRRKNKNGKPMKKGNPWMHSSSEEEVADEEEEHYDVEEEEEELVFNGSDHEFSPESDLEDGAESSPSRHARTAKQKEEAVDKYSETNCNKCKKGDHPEWILLCDECDKGWHASCVIPQLWVIPEGQWFCPPCEHNMLVQKLNENLVEYEKILKRRENDVLRKQRLAYVGISLNNVLPSAEKEDEQQAEDEDEAPQRKSKKQRRNRLIYSDEELEEFIDDDDGSGSESGSGSGSYESEDEPMYKLRARRATKAFNFQEYDDMIKSALRDSDAEEEIEGVNGKDDAKVTANDNAKAGDSENKEATEKEERTVPRRSGKGIDDETDEEELDEKEKNRRKIFNQGARKTKRRLNDLSATSEEDSDEDFKGSAEDDDDDEEEENVAEDDSEWSGDGGSDDSIAVSGRRRKRQKLGRRERYSDDGTVRRSTRRRKPKIKYDESDQDEDDDDEEGEKWQSGESESSVSESESDDETWGKKKKKKPTPGKSSVPNFFTQVGNIAKKSKPKKKKRRKTDEDEVDRAWSNKFGSKSKKLVEEPVERKTRGRKINFKDILDSGESDDDGNIRPKRRRILSDSDEDEDGESPSSSRKLADEIRAENQRLEAEAKELLKREEKAKEQAKLERTPKKESSGSKSKAKTLAFSQAHREGEIPSLPLQSPILAQELLSGSDDPSKSVKITKSIVESILRKSPGLSDSPPPSSPNMIPTILHGPIPVPVPIIQSLPVPESHLSLAAMNTLSPVYLPTVIPSIPPVSGTGPGTGSARVGKKKTASMLSASAASTDVLPFPSSKKSAAPAVTQSSPKPLPPSAGLPSMGLPQTLPPNMQELQRLAGAGPMYPGNPALRAFHPAWMRNPPPYAGPPPPQSLGKPPPLNNASFVPQSSQLRPTSYGQPPPNIRVPSPNQMQAFQHFAKRTADAGVAPYRLPPHQLPRGTVLPPMGRDRERVFMGGNSPYTPYGILPPHPQGQPPHPSLFGAHFDYRHAETYKDDPSDRSNQSPPVSQSPPTTSSLTSISTAPAPPPQKDDVGGPTPGDGEFGGLVSYFSSQHSNDDD